jgi:hypothetical protein
LEALIESNAIVMKQYIDCYAGLEIRGIKITKAGILAGCHLGGPGGMKAYLDSNGYDNRTDIYNTSIEKYLKNYQIFDLSLNLIKT